MLTPLQRKKLSRTSAGTATPPGVMIRRRMKLLGLILLSLVLVHSLMMIMLEDLSAKESLWLTFTTLATVGYGDLSPATDGGRLATVVLLYLSAIVVFTLILSDYVEYRFYRRERILTGRWRLNMKNHIVIINAPRHGAGQYFIRIVNQIRSEPGYEQTPILLLSRQYDGGLPPEMQDAGISLVHGSGNDELSLKRAHVGQARHIVILASDESSGDSDSLTFDILHRLHEYRLASRTIAECVSDANRQRMERLGAMSVIRPVRTYPEIMVRAMVAPGSEKVMEDMFSHENDHPHRYDLHIDDLTWADVVSALIRADLGTAMAYLDTDRNIVCHPPANEDIDGKGLIVLVKTDNTPSREDVQAALDRYREYLAKWHQRVSPKETSAE